LWIWSTDILDIGCGSKFTKLAKLFLIPVVMTQVWLDSGAMKDNLNNLFYLMHIPESLEIQI
jgi:hypothetical protein